MIVLFTTAITSPILIVLTVLFVITSAITVFDKRLIQAKRSGQIPLDSPVLPSWVGLAWWVHGGLLVAIVLLNWKFALSIYVIKFILSVLPVLETIGNILMRPFRLQK